MKKIYFYLASDTLIYLSENIIKDLIKNGNNITILIPKYFNENAEKAIKNILPEVNYKYFNIFDFMNNKPDSIVFGNDWAPEAKLIIFFARKYNILTYCIQESVVDFGDGSGKLEYSDFIFIQGEQTIEHLKRENLILSGNPRYENLKLTEIKNNQVLINCNFTYGVYEDIRDNWVDDIVRICNKFNINYKISQHPRDKGNLSRYKNNIINSSAGTIEQQLINSSIIITRFSSVIHEAIMLGRKVIYYNPHGEKMFYDFKPDNKVLFIANNYDELITILPKAFDENININDLNLYIKKHVKPFDEKPSTIISNFIRNNVKYIQSNKKINMIKTIMIYLKIIFLYYLRNK